MDTQGNSSILQPGSFVYIFGYKEMIHTHTFGGCSALVAFGATPSVDIYPVNVLVLAAQEFAILT